MLHSFCSGQPKAEPETPRDAMEVARLHLGLCTSFLCQGIPGNILHLFASWEFD